MIINEILNNIGMTKYKLAKLSGIPNATISELCSGKTDIKKCSGETLYRIAKVLNVSVESLLEGRIEDIEFQLAKERFYESNLPPYLKKALENYKKAVSDNSAEIDYYIKKLYKSINKAEIEDKIISSRHANYLKQRY